MIKSTVKSVLARCGFVLQRTNPLNQEGSSAPSSCINDVLAHFSRLGFEPQTVIDVGVASGTPALYTSFPNAFHLLIEPLEEFREQIQASLQRYRGKAVFAAATSVEGQVCIHVHTDHLDGSSLLREQMGSEFDGVTRTVNAITIDSIVDQERLSGPFLIKIDVQGAELEVLKGATRVLKDTAIVLLEVSFFEFLKDAPQFYDVISSMKDAGFVAYDVYGYQRRPLDGALGQCDIAFVREDGMFRKDHRYATPEQWTNLTAP